MVSGSRLEEYCTSAPEDGHMEEQFQFQCRGLELGHSLKGGPESLKALGVLANGVGVTW